MLQTLHNWKICLWIPGFKSPRECYKPACISACNAVQLLRFKSPRECYKLYSDVRMEMINPVVSSPQGNATNTNIRLNENRNRVSFKSPRECYKQHSLQIANYGGQPCFKSPRECYKRIRYSCRLDIHHTFQVPKGMLQTFLGMKSSIGDSKVSSPQGNATNCQF